MIQWYFVMTNHFVVEVGDVQMPIRSKLQVNRPEPRIVARQQVGQCNRFGSRTMVFDAIAIDAAGHDIAAKEIILKGDWKPGILGMYKSSNGRATVQVVHHRRNKSKSVVRTAEAWVAAPQNQLRYRFAVTVGGIPESPSIAG